MFELVLSPMFPPSPYAAQLAAKPLTRLSLAVRGGTTELWIYEPAPIHGPDGQDAAGQGAHGRGADGRGADGQGAAGQGAAEADAASRTVSGTGTVLGGDASSTLGVPPTTILMVHGFRGDHHGLEPIAAQLQRYRVIVPDLPGFGISTPLGVTHDIAGYSAWLRDLVDQLAARSQLAGDVVILGHSFGSIIVSAALADGLTADRVVLVNPIAQPALSGPRGILTRLALFYYQVGAWLPQKIGFAWLRLAIVTRFISITMAKTKDPSLRRWIHSQHHQYFGAFSNRAVVTAAFEASVGNDVSEFAAKISPPTLLIAGDKDDITPVAAQERLAALIPDARLVVLGGVGHLIHYEKPAEAAQAIEAFLTAKHTA